METMIADEILVPELETYADVTVSVTFEDGYDDDGRYGKILTLKAVAAVDRETGDEIDVNLLDERELSNALCYLEKKYIEKTF